jgi:hypothetical protein
MIDVPHQSCCPFCSTVFTEPRPPNDDDLYFCLACGEWIEFQWDGWHIPSSATYHEIHRSPELRGIMGAWLATRADRP